MQNISNLYGRALEYAIVAELIQQLPPNQIELTQRALQDQQRDCQNYLSLSASMQQNYQRCAENIFDWLNLNFAILTQPILIDRLPDHASRQGDVTDIRITTRSQQINLSVKHNHKALKHQRPASTAQHCGYTKGSQEDTQFRIDYQHITNSFVATAQGFNNFRDLSEGVVLTNLYIPMCELVARFINNFCYLQLNASHLFTFLVGRIDFYKVIFHEQQGVVIIEAFNNLPPVTSVIARNNQNYVNLQFSNAWAISMRLHTASSQIQSNPSLKFDTQPVNIIVPRQQLNL